MKNNKNQTSRGIDKTIGSAIGGAIDSAVGTALGSVGFVGRMLGSSLRLPGLYHRGILSPSMSPGTPPGIAHYTEVDQLPEPGEVIIHCTDYSQDRIEPFIVEDVLTFLSQPPPEWAKIRWINISGLHPYIVNRIREAFGLHILAAEDVMNVPQRPRVEAYNDHLFIVTRILSLRNNELKSEQISIFFTTRLLITFQETKDDLWKPIVDRLNEVESRIRKRDVSYLAYALLDIIVDHGFPILEQYGNVLDKIEDDVISSSSSEVLQHVHTIKRQLAALRKVYWPTREVISQLCREEQIIISDTTRPFLRDVYDHCIQILDLIETFRDMAASLLDLSISITSQRTNEVMRVLTIMATIFIPATFLAGVYGMNFEYIPELKMRYAYPAFWGVCVTLVGGLIYYFIRKGWMKNG